MVDIQKQEVFISFQINGNKFNLFSVLLNCNKISFNLLQKYNKLIKTYN